jgi:hypothetical protein
VTWHGEADVTGFTDARPEEDTTRIAENQVLGSLKSSNSTILGSLSPSVLDTLSPASPWYISAFLVHQIPSKGLPK